MNLENYTRHIYWRAVMLGPFYEFKVFFEHLSRVSRPTATRYVKLFNWFFVLAHLAIVVFTLTEKSDWIRADLTTIVKSWIACSGLYIASFVIAEFATLDRQWDPDINREPDLISHISCTLRALVAAPAIVFFVSAAKLLGL